MSVFQDITPEERTLLTLLRARPAIYLHDPSFPGLVHFLDGYRVAMMRHSLHDVRLLPEGFDDYVAHLYTGEDAGARSWATILAAHEPDDGNAVMRFWQILDTCLTDNGCAPIPTPSAPPPAPSHPDGIAPIGRTDLPRLAESYMRTFNGEPWWDRWDRDTALRRLRDLWETPGALCLALWERGELLGAVIGRRERYYHGDCFQIVEFWVEPATQRKGCGRRLMTALLERLREEGVAQVYLITMHSESTVGFYQKNGFLVQDDLCIMQLSSH